MEYALSRDSELDILAYDLVDGVVFEDTDERSEGVYEDRNYDSFILLDDFIKEKVNRISLEFRNAVGFVGVESIVNYEWIDLPVVNFINMDEIPEDIIKDGMVADLQPDTRYNTLQRWIVDFARLCGVEPNIDDVNWVERSMTSRIIALEVASPYLVLDDPADFANLLNGVDLDARFSESVAGIRYDDFRRTPVKLDDYIESWFDLNGIDSVFSKHMTPVVKSHILDLVLFQGYDIFTDGPEEMRQTMLEYLQRVMNEEV